MSGKIEPVALVDMDGTLADYHGTMTRELAELFGDDLARVGPATIKRATRLIRQRPGFWRNLPLLPLGVKIVELLCRVGFKISILTKGPFHSTNAWTEKVEWCRAEWSRPFGTLDVTITMDKGLVYGKILVDDWPEYVHRWLEWRPRGLVVVPAQPWNEGLNGGNIRRVASAEDVEALEPELKEQFARNRGGEQ